MVHRGNRTPGVLHRPVVLSLQTRSVRRPHAGARQAGGRLPTSGTGVLGSADAPVWRWPSYPRRRSARRGSHEVSLRHFVVLACV